MILVYHIYQVEASVVATWGNREMQSPVTQSPRLQDRSILTLSDNESDYLEEDLTNFA
jgi:hypothetical protein